ncbi:MAG: EpsG family protein [Candidatus Saccharibacteria bacterium]|nr:EpsG family protein [Candidatus Saccharibacteria bacterium]
MTMLASVLLYFLVIAVSAFFVACKKTAVITVKGRRHVIRWPVLLGLFLPLALGSLRYGTGADYPNYLEIYQFFATGEETGATAAYFLKVEPLFHLLPKISYALTGTPVVFFASVWTATLVLLYIGMQRLLPRTDGLLLGMAWSLMLIIMMPLAFDQMRQTLAIALFFFAVYYIVIGKPLRYIAVMAIAVTSHFSALFFVPAYLIRPLIHKLPAQHLWRVNGIAIGVGIMAILAVIGMAIMFQEGLRSLDIHYINYALKSLYDGKGFRLLGLIRVNYWTITMGGLLLWGLWRLYHHRAAHIITYRVQVVLLSVGLMLLTLSAFISFGGRLTQYLLPIVPVAVYATANYTMRRRLGLTQVGLFVCMMVCNWNWILPYSSLWHQVDFNDVNRHQSLLNRMLCLRDESKCVIKSGQQYDNQALWRLGR